MPADGCCLADPDVCLQLTAVLEMSHELLQLVPQLAGLPGGAAKTLQGSLLGGLRSEARVAFQDFEAGVGRDPSKTSGEQCFFRSC